MSVFSFLSYLVSYRRKIFKLRKKYDRTREKADKTKDRESRLSALKVLDQIEPTLIILEEQKVSRFERSKMFRFVNAGVEEAKTILNGRKLPQRIPARQNERQRQYR